MFTAPVAFASNLADDPLVNSATAHDTASGASGSASDSDVLDAQATLSVTKSDGSTTYTPGGSATYMIVVTNAGPTDATDATVSDTLPAGVTLSANVACVAAGTATCGSVTGTTNQSSFGTTGASIGAGAGNSLTFTVPVAFAANMTAGTITNTVTATDPASASPATASDSDTLAVQVDLAITKTDGVTSVTPGNTTTYTIIVSNAGPSGAAGATVTDTFPAAIASVSWTCVATGGGSCTASRTGNINDTVNVPAGATLTYTAIATIASSATGTLANTAVVAAPAGATDTNPANNTASDTDTIGSAGGTADSRVTKAHASPIVSGGTTVYTIVVSNLGPQPADGAVLVDPSVAGLDKTSASCGGATGGAQCPVSPTIGELQSGIAIPVLPVSGSVTFTVAAHVIASTGTVSNNSTVTPPAGLTDPDPNDNQVVDSGPVNPPKGADPGPCSRSRRSTRAH